jgi:hypothetical protein
LVDFFYFKKKPIFTIDMLPSFPYFDFDVFKKTSYRDLYFGNIIKNVQKESLKDPGFMNPRVKNLLQDIDAVSAELESYALQNPLAAPPPETKKKVDEIYATAKRLRVYPD